MDATMAVAVGSGIVAGVAVAWCCRLARRLKGAEVEMDVRFGMFNHALDGMPEKAARAMIRRMERVQAERSGQRPRPRVRREEPLV